LLLLPESARVHGYLRLALILGSVGDGSILEHHLVGAAIVTGKSKKRKTTNGKRVVDAFVVTRSGRRTANMGTVDGSPTLPFNLTYPMQPFNRTNGTASSDVSE